MKMDWGYMKSQGLGIGLEHELYEPTQCGWDLAAHTVHAIYEDVVQVLGVVAPKVVLRTTVGRHQDPRRQIHVDSVTGLPSVFFMLNNTCRSLGEQDLARRCGCCYE
jgi:hypothetical protein